MLVGADGGGSKTRKELARYMDNANFAPEDRSGRDPFLIDRETEQRCPPDPHDPLKQYINAKPAIARIGES